MYRKICLTAVLLSCFFSTPAFAQNVDLRKVNHIIIVMQENHSFDNYFGVLAYASGSPYRNGNGACAATDNRCVDGLTCRADSLGNLTCSNSNLDDNGAVVRAFHEPSRCVTPDLDHSWFGAHHEGNFLSPNSTLTSFLADGFVRGSNRPDAGAGNRQTRRERDEQDAPARGRGLGHPPRGVTSGGRLGARVREGKSCRPKGFFGESQEHS